MEIQWLENTSFILKNAYGKKILMDSSILSCSANNSNLNADILTLSHIPVNINVNDIFSTIPTVITTTNAFDNSFVSISGIDTFRDSSNGCKRGPNIVYIYNIDNLKIAHLGMLGHNLDDKTIYKLKDLDFLFIPIGGRFSIDGNIAAKLALSIKSKYIIPMYYNNSTKSNYLDGPKKFLSHFKNVVKFDSTIIYTKDLSFSDTNKVLLLNSLY